jgi:hypothetical protein
MLVRQAGYSGQGGASSGFEAGPGGVAVRTLGLGDLCQFDEEVALFAEHVIRDERHQAAEGFFGAQKGPQLLEETGKEADFFVHLMVVAVKSREAVDAGAEVALKLEGFAVEVSEGFGETLAGFLKGFLRHVETCGYSGGVALGVGNPEDFVVERVPKRRRFFGQQAFEYPQVFFQFVHHVIEECWRHVRFQLVANMAAEEFEFKAAELAGAFGGGGREVGKPGAAWLLVCLAEQPIESFDEAAGFFHRLFFGRGQGVHDKAGVVAEHLQPKAVFEDGGRFVI